MRLEKNMPFSLAPALVLVLVLPNAQNFHVDKTRRPTHPARIGEA